MPVITGENEKRCSNREISFPKSLGAGVLKTLPVVAIRSNTRIITYRFNSFQMFVRWDWLFVCRG